MVEGTSNTIFGMDGDLFTGGATFKVTLGSGTGTWVQSEQVTWATGMGYVIGVDDLDGTTAGEIWVHLNTGVNPLSGETLTGAGAATGVPSADATGLAPAANLIGLYTGAWIGHYGIGFTYAEMTKDDSVTPLDNSGAIKPPNNVSVSVTVSGTTLSHVFLTESTGTVINESQYTVATATSGTTSFIINEAIESDTPTAGWILVKEGTTFEPVEYTSWSGSTFTVASLGTTYTAAKTVIIPIFYDEVATDGGTVTTSLIQSTDITVAGWVRQGTPTNPGTPVEISGTIGTAGLSLSVAVAAE